MKVLGLLEKSFTLDIWKSGQFCPQSQDSTIQRFRTEVKIEVRAKKKPSRLG